MARRWRWAGLIGLVLAGTAQAAPPEGAVAIGGFAIDATEVTVEAFARHAAALGLQTAAEREGGGHEYVGGWQRRPGWSYRSPSGKPAQPTDPAAHLTWFEARDYCAAKGGRLPTLAEWREAAFTERRAAPSDGFERGRTYPFPVGEKPGGMNLAGTDPASGDVWERHAPTGATRRGVNGLHDMGANLWEWLADRRGSEALTAGGSWWYGPAQTRSEAPQWKAADFTAVYIGFRCVYG
jgi:sulfatase modifying factor 1